MWEFIEVTAILTGVSRLQEIRKRIRR